MSSPQDLLRKLKEEDVDVGKVATKIARNPSLAKDLFDLGAHKHTKILGDPS